MINIAFKHFPGDDLDDFVQKVEKSFDIIFEPYELAHIETIKELKDHLIKKMKDNLSSGCTTQQAFYKFKAAVTQVTDNTSITPQTLLSDIFPKQNRRQIVKEVNKALNFELNILEPPGLLSSSLMILLLASFISLFFNWKFGLCALATVILCIRIAYYFGKELSLHTVGQVTEKIMNSNYSKARRRIGTINESEIERVLFSLFLESQAYSEEELADFAM